MATYIREHAQHAIIRRTAEEKGFGDKGFSAALRFILRDWDRFEQILYSLQRHGHPDDMDPFIRSDDEPPAIANRELNPGKGTPIHDP